MNYPAIAFYDGDDLLEVVAEKEQLQVLLNTTTAECQVLDSHGSLYQLNRSSDNQYTLTDTNSKLPTAEAVILAQKHMAALDQCCVAKFYAASVKEVIAALVTMDDK